MKDTLIPLAIAFVDGEPRRGDPGDGAVRGATPARRTMPRRRTPTPWRRTAGGSPTTAIAEGDRVRELRWIRSASEPVARLPALLGRARHGLVPRGRRLLGGRVHGVPHAHGGLAHARPARGRARGPAPGAPGARGRPSATAPSGYWVDPERRRIPDHWHAHARPAGEFFDPASDLYGRYWSPASRCGVVTSPFRRAGRAFGRLTPLLAAR